MSRGGWLVPFQCVIDGVLIGEGLFTITHGDWGIGGLLLGCGGVFLGLAAIQTRGRRVTQGTLRLVASHANLAVLAHPFPPTIVWTADDGVWVARHPDWPDVVATGTTEAEARHSWEIVCGMAVRACREAGFPVPPGRDYIVRPLNPPERFDE